MRFANTVQKSEFITGVQEVLCHGDYSFHNLLYEKHCDGSYKFRAIVDFQVVSNNFKFIFNTLLKQMLQSVNWGNAAQDLSRLFVTAMSGKVIAEFYKRNWQKIMNSGPSRF